MTIRFLSISLSLLLGVAWATLPSVDLVPEERMGERGPFHAKEVIWKFESPWFGRKATVCKVKPLPRDFGILISLAEQQGMSLVEKWSPISDGSLEKGCLFYQGKPRKGLFINPDTGYRVFFIRPSHRLERKESGEPILKGLPSKEEALKIGREWLAKLGIGEDQLMPDPQHPGRPQVHVGEFTETSWNERLQERTTKAIAYELTFTQKIGDFPAAWNGFGGRVAMCIEDGGAYSGAKWCLRGWEPMGEYPLLDRDEIVSAMKEGFCWIYASPLQMDVVTKAESIEVTECRISAFQDRHREPQRHFPLLWKLKVQPAGKPDQSVWVTIPALKQHRDKYPLPVTPKRERGSKRETF